MPSNKSPAAAARAKLVQKYDREARSTQDMADLARRDKRDSTAANLSNLAERKRTYAERARRPVGTQGERVPAKPALVPSKVKRKRSG